MNKILIFAGTTEGRQLSECLADAQIEHTLCVATEYGEIVLKEHPMVQVHCGRMDKEAILHFIKQGGYTIVIDATHPYATMVTQNIKEAVNELHIEYFRLNRDTKADSEYENTVWFESSEECAKALENTEGNILLTTGSKELSVYCQSEEVKNRLFVRVLPGLESIFLCSQQGISGKQILALQGPFSEEMNEAMIRQYRISCLVTKQSGRIGGFQEKLTAAQRTGIPVYVVGKTSTTEGYSFGELCQKLEILCGCKINYKRPMEILLAGVGMGGKENLTGQVRQAISQADILLGAKRLIEAYEPRMEKQPFYTPEQIIPYLKEKQKEEWSQPVCRVVVLFSGDCGFYSGCPALYQALKETISQEELEASVRILPGISSVAYLSSFIGESYQDAQILSIHGKTLSNLSERIRTNRKTFLLLSGVKDLKNLGALLLEENLSHCHIVAGYQLSYPEQKILSLTPAECCQQEQDGLYICFISNPKAEQKMLTHGKADGEFFRDKVPMTKEEVREVSICKLHLTEGAVVYDIGSGTGSIAVEIAGLSDDLSVYAIEQKEEAVNLIEQNRKQFHLKNLTTIQAKAPDGFSDLPMPTHAFIGGSGGNLKEILDVLYQRNPHMRVVLNAISLETLCEIKEILSLYPVKKEELIQLQVNRANKLGNYHLMQAGNPVWICSFEFGSRQES